MKCIKCLTKNINQANYCKNCGYVFNDKEREIASRWTPVWILEKFEKIKNICSGKFDFLSFITDTLAYKICSLLVVLVVGIYFMIAHGINVKIEKSDNYRLGYNEEAKEYYVFVKEEQTLLNLYLPNDTEEIILTNYDHDEKILSEETFGRDQEIAIKAGVDDYYVLTAKQKSKETEFKMFVYLEGGENHE